MKNKNTKHEMLRLAKQIASKEYKDRIEKVKNLGTFQYEEYITPARIIMEDEIRYYLKLYPDFESSEFRKMITNFKQRLNDKFNNFEENR